MKILFLTSHNLATNPRLVKEIQLANENGFRVEVICFEFNNWSKKLNDQLLTELLPARIINLSLPERLTPSWIISKLISVIKKFCSYLLPLPDSVLSDAISIQSALLVRELKNVSKPDIVIGHNPAAIYPALLSAQKFGCNAGFDMEDYHSGEGSNKLVLRLLKKNDEEYDPFI